MISSIEREALPLPPRCSAPPDLRSELRERLRHGDSDAQVLAYLSERYGDFVLYRPPLKSSTWALWFGPGLLMLAGVMTLGIVLRRVPREEAPDHG